MNAYEVYADSRELTRDQWLAQRRQGLGGSDAGAIMGVHPYKGTFSVWADKLGKLPETEDSEAMRQGRDLEDYVARRFSEKSGLRVRREYGMLRSLEHPFMVANIDRRIIGQRAGLECKTSRDIYMKRYQNGDFPMEYYCQILHYLAVTGWEKWHLAVLVFGTELLIFEIRREDVEDDLEALIRAEKAFWKHYIDGQEVPPPDGLESTGRAVSAVWPDSDGTRMEADDQAERDMLELAGIKEERKALEKRERALENVIKARMGNAEELAGVSVSASWKPYKQRRISEKRIRAMYPEIRMEEIREESTGRRFEIKTEEE